MPCYRPLAGYYGAKRNPKTGKRPIVFTKRDALVDRPIDVPCGQCVGCKLERSRQWAIRCVHESMLYPNNCFVTLTYDDKNLPENGSLVPEHLRKFMHDLRHRYGTGIRFFACGEYGEQKQRPHYHVCLFNHDFGDKVKWKQNAQGDWLFLSSELQSLWDRGFTSLGALTFETAAYTARYVVKKRTGYQKEMELQWFDPETGELRTRHSEFGRMSRMPGIGKPWLEKYGKDVKYGDFVVMRGRKMQPPRYYDEQFEITDPTYQRGVRKARVREARKHRWNNTSGRHRVRETVQEAKLKALKRELD